MSAPIELVALVGPHAYNAGAAYQRQHRARVRRHDAEAGVVVGHVEGSGRNLYATTVYYQRSRHGTINEFDGQCSCPVRVDCKHSVALLLAALAETTRQRPQLGQWRALLEAAFPDPQLETPSALALEFDLQVSPESDQRWGPSGTFQARALKVGRRGAWVATGATWSDLNRSAVPDADDDQVAALQALLALTVASSYGYGLPTWLQLGQVATRGLWPALADVAASGVQLLDSARRPAVLWQEPARPEVVLAHGPEESATTTVADLQVRAEITLPGGLRLTELLLLGQPAHGVVGRDDAGVLHLLPFDQPAATPWLRLRERGTVTVPVRERALFERTLLPRIARTRWRSESGYEPEAPAHPVLVVSVRALASTHGSTPRLVTQLGWRYGAADSDFPYRPSFAADPRDPLRDGTAERLLLARAAGALERLPALLGRDGSPLAEAVVSGHDVVVLLDEVTPALCALADVEVDLPAELPVFTDLGDVTIALEVTARERDWFDLEVQLRLADREIEVGRVIAALGRGERTLFLDDGGYVDLDRPELDRLRALLEEGRALTDRRAERVRVSRLDLSWWEELEALGVIDRQAQEWLETLRAATTQGDPPPLPQGLRAELRPYQRAGYDWLARLRRNGLGGVLADDMGLGKTLQILAMILDAVEQGTTAEHPFIVVAPTSVVGNWAAEAARFAPDLRVATVTATQARRRTPLAEVAAGCDVVITSYALFRLEHEEYAALEPVGLVLDEAQHVKNRQSKAFALAKTLGAPMTFVVTGTPMENHLGELWAMFALAAPGLLGTPQQFHEFYAAPIERGNGGDQLARLRHRIAPFLLRRTKEAVAPELPPKQEQVLEVELAPAHRRVYQRHLQRERQRVLGLLADMDTNRVEVLSALTRLRQLAIDASLVDPEYASVPSSKLEALLELLAEAAAEGHRVLVFSQFTRYLRKIAARLESTGVAYSYLDGSTTRRPEVIREFAEGEAPVFLISLKAGGVGLNLAMADYCVLADPWWNPAAEAQAVDRAHRIGQTRSVMVYRMVATGTIEEKVMALQEAKRALVAGVLGGTGDGAASRALTAEDVRALLA